MFSFSFLAVQQLWMCNVFVGVCWSTQSLVGLLKPVQSKSKEGHWPCTIVCGLTAYTALKKEVCFSWFAQFARRALLNK